MAELETTIKVDATEALASIEGLEAQLHAEVEAMWQSLFANVCNQVDTRIHNFMHGEKEALKARISALFHKEA
jgi:hypothetical protein